MHCLKFLSFLRLSIDIYGLKMATEGDLERGIRYDVNFAPELKEIISDSKHLEQLGYHVPDLAQNVALQEERFFR